jgi:hypothetical protein
MLHYCTAAQRLARVTLFTLITQFVFKPEMFTVTTLGANYAVLVALRLKTFNTRLFVGVLLYKIQEIHFAEI